MELIALEFFTSEIRCPELRGRLAHFSHTYRPQLTTDTDRERFDRITGWLLGGAGNRKDHPWQLSEEYALCAQLTQQIINSGKEQFVNAWRAVLETAEEESVPVTIGGRAPMDKRFPLSRLLLDEVDLTPSVAEIGQHPIEESLSAIDNIGQYTLGTDRPLEATRQLLNASDVTCWICHNSDASQIFGYALALTVRTGGTTGHCLWEVALLPEAYGLPIAQEFVDEVKNQLEAKNSDWYALLAPQTHQLLHQCWKENNSAPQEGYISPTSPVAPAYTFSSVQKSDTSVPAANMVADAVQDFLAQEKAKESCWTKAVRMVYGVEGLFWEIWHGQLV